MKRFIAQCDVGTMEILMEMKRERGWSVDHVTPPSVYPRALRLYALYRSMVLNMDLSAK